MNNKLTELEKKVLVELANRSHLKIDHIVNSVFGNVCFPNDIKNARQMLWHLECNSMVIPLCPVCQNNLSWHPDKREYRKFCSKKCTGIGTADIAKQTSIENNNGVHHTQTKEFVEKQKATSLKKYGVEHYSQTTEFKESTQNANIDKFGVNYPAQSVEIQEKMKSTTFERYGVDHFASTTECRDKMKKTCLERYGSEFVASLPEIKDKIKQTNLERYGFEYATQNPNIMEKIATTRKFNYYDPIVLSKLNDPEWLRNEQQTKTVNAIANELGVSSSNLGKYFANYNIPINIVNQHTSDAQLEINNFITDLGVSTIQGSRSIIYPKEIDIYIPDHKLAIEYNGIYYHTESKGRGYSYHLDKTNACEKLGIKLLHISDHEWINDVKKSIWKSMIINRLGFSFKLYARKCRFATVSTPEARKFMEENHLEGFVGGKHKYGLYYDDELVQCIIISKSRYNKKYDFELIRLATKKNTVVIGGISKLLSNITDISGSVITYANRRYSTGNAYSTNNMEKVSTSGPNVFYTSKNGTTIETRHVYQKHKLPNILPIFDANLSAWKNLEKNGYDRFWDCGTLSFTFNLK